MAEKWNPKITNYRANGEIFNPADVVVPRTLTGYYELLVRVAKENEAKAR